jgi:probable phosphoglycerate mutase
MGSLFLVRHSITEASSEARNLGQASDPPLADVGVELAAALGRTIALELAELPHDRIRVLTSPARRCRETAAAICIGLDVDQRDVEVDPDLIEIDYGAWEGLTAEECHERDPELRAQWEADPYHTSCPDGESGADVAARAFPAMEPVERWLAEDRARCAVLVAHNHVTRLRLCALLGWPMRAYRDRVTMDPAGYSIVTFGGDRPVVRRVNAASV